MTGHTTGHAGELPLHRPVAARDVPPEGLDVAVEATTEEREDLARSLGLPAVHRLVGRFHVRGSPQRLAVDGQVEASVRQVCVVSLEPFDTTVSESVAVVFADPAGATDISAGTLAPAAKDREPPDDMVNGIIDLGALTAEFLSLGLDPYPRKPGVAFSFESKSQAGSSPFAALARLKRGASDKS